MNVIQKTQILYKTTQKLQQGSPKFQTKPFVFSITETSSMATGSQLNSIEIIVGLVDCYSK